MPTCGPAVPAGQPVTVFPTSSVGIGIPVGIGRVDIFTHFESGFGSAPPYMPNVAPPLIGFRSPQEKPELSSRAFGPPAAKRKSRPPLVPGEMLARRPDRSMCPSVPTMIDAHSSVAFVPYRQTPPTSFVPVGHVG